MQELIPDFERKNPDIRVNYINLANNNELKYSLIARASSNRGPDVVRMDISWVPEFSHQGLLEPLTGFPGFELLHNVFHRKAMSVGYYKNQYYSLPLNLYTKSAIFNRELLEDIQNLQGPWMKFWSLLVSITSRLDWGDWKLGIHFHTFSALEVRLWMRSSPGLPDF
ncbi:Bacterial extracellular solute-binding protein [compost metagenome]